MIMWVVQSTFRRKSQLTTPTTHMNEKYCVAAFLPVAPTHSTAQHSATLHRRVPARGKKKPVQITGALNSGMEPGGPDMLHMFLSFLLVSDVTW